MYLVAALGLTESSILEASFRSKHIIRRVVTDPYTNRADLLLLGYEEAINSN